MAEIVVTWLEQSILQCNYPKGWNWQDYHENLDRLHHDLGDNPDPIYIINVYEPGAGLPSGSPVPHQNRARRVLNIRYIVYVTVDTILKQQLRIFLQGIQYHEHANYEFADTIPDALAIIRAKDA